jgi:Uma2 family endonuclease
MTHTASPIKKSTSKAPTTVEEFEKWVLSRKLKSIYEFRYGNIIKKGGMKQIELLIVKFLTRLFAHASAYQNGGELVQEIDIPIDEFRKRVADLAYFTENQIVATANGQKAVPSFAIELLSPNEILEDIEDKIQDYFDAGVQVVWYISPKKKLIYVYTSPTDVMICKGETICHARPALPDFEFKTEDLFHIPTI